MAHLRRILLSLVIAALVAAVFTELSMTRSTQVAASELQEWEMSDSEIAMLSEQSGISEAEIRQQIQAIESSAGNSWAYPGYWIFWFRAFTLMFIACFVALMIQLYLLSSKFNKYFKLDAHSRAT